MNDHFRPVGKPAPPRPRSPEDFTSLMMASRPVSRIPLGPSQAPRERAPFRPQSWSPYRFLKMRSLSASIERPFSDHAGFGLSLRLSSPTRGGGTPGPLTFPGSPP